MTDNATLDTQILDILLRAGSRWVLWLLLALSLAAISEALVATAVGLIVALPAVAAYNAFTRHVETAASSAEAIDATLVTPPTVP